eukprot:CAMPEP_0194129818 /NCGR_PEP_ID=MMETSP0152-20130528/1029_1 /TAXON_ID=1049557 /ORGANISM="Thalassiothrix antarctica, Strain L6-D1" /LENGTH=63 /DNA_ID=CAMNT_0038824169 /DNA_START=39 /DNA_END=230 /DNA_ORIENTATION=+
MPASCAEAALIYLSCLEKTPCVMEEKRDIKDCIKAELVNECKVVRYAYTMCKHKQQNKGTVAE